jgi:hypothetical protein
VTVSRAITVFVLAAMLGVAVIATGPSRANGPMPAMLPAAHGTLPAEVHQAGPLAEMAYQAAIDQPDVVYSVPCLCGCIETLGHQSNLDCYIEDAQDSATTIYSSHGLYCGVCQLITQDALAGAAVGMSPESLRTMVVEKYGR